MHRTSDRFWKCFEKLPPPVQNIAKQNFELLKNNSRHPSLHFKKVGKLWSVRATLNHRDLPLRTVQILYGSGLELTMIMGK